MGRAHAVLSALERRPPGVPIHSQPPLTDPALVALDIQAADREDVIRQLILLLVAAGRVDDGDSFHAEVSAREAQMATGMAGRVGLPHARSANVLIPSVAVARVAGGVDFDAPDGLADLVFLVAAPASDAPLFLRILAAIARLLVDDSFRDAVRSADSTADVADLIISRVQV